MLFGDASPFNLIYKSTEDGNASDELLAMVDWQSAHYGSCSNDLALLCSFMTESAQPETLIRDFYEV